MRKLIAAALMTAACAACFVAGQVSAEEESGGGFPMPEWTKMGKEHESFKKLAGEWDISQKMWMMPGQPPMESKAFSSSKLLWGGRFVEMDYRGDMMGTPFKGRLLMGFDRVDKKYVSVWMENLSAYMSISYGTEKDGVITYTMNDPDYMTGQKKKTQMQMKWVDDDTYTLTFVDDSGAGEPRTTMQMTYSRKKE